MNKDGKMLDDQSGAGRAYTRRDALRSVGKYALVSGAAVVALSADDAVMANPGASSPACSNPNPPASCSQAQTGNLFAAPPAPAPPATPTK